MVSLKSDKKTGTLHKYLCTFMIISRWILLRIKNISDNTSRENQNTHFMFNKVPHPHPPTTENRAVYEIVWKNVVETDVPHMTI